MPRRKAQSLALDIFGPARLQSRDLLHNIDYGRFVHGEHVDFRIEFLGLALEISTRAFVPLNTAS